MVVRENCTDLKKGVLILLACGPLGFALDSSIDINQYAHTAWPVREGFFSGIINTIAQTPDGYLWFGGEFGMLRFDGVRIVPWQLQAGEQLPSNNVLRVLAAHDGRLWIGTLEGLASWKDGRLIHYPELAGQQVLALLEDRKGTIWVGGWATSGGRLCAIQGDIARCSGQDGSLGRGVRSLDEDSRGDLWAGGSTGLRRWKPDPPKLFPMPNPMPEIPALMEGDNGALLIAERGGMRRFVAEKSEVYQPPGATGPFSPLSLLKDRDGGIWIGTMDRGLLRAHRGRTDRFSRADGLSGDFVTCLFEDREGNIWVATAGGLDRFRDFRPFNKLPPPVHIEQVRADGKIYDASHGIHLPALVRNVWIDYTALSLVAPEKVYFRYKLEGQFPDWIEVGNVRQAAYSNLAPGHYRFRVMACNNSGVWNEAGDSLDFSIAPAYYQTGWFQASCAAAFFLMLWGLYRYRLHQIAHEFNMRLEERVGERTRIARELHDTLLQSFQGALFEFQASRNLFSRRPEEAIRTLDDAICSAEQAIVEGRDAIQDLRPGPTDQTDLEHLLTTAGQELASSQDSNGNCPVFRVTVEGPPQTLSPVLQDEVYRIGREVLRNAFRHAHANRIEAEIRYDIRLLRLRIRDDGKGIDRNVLEKGARAGHWGLPGVRERAKRIGARLVFWSEIGAGTEVELTVPSRVAYAKSHVRRRFGLFRKKSEVS
jgi:hypothetical protein